MNKIIYFPCTVCKKEVKNDAIQCDLCSLWSHRTCAKLSKRELIKLSDPTYYYNCPLCFNIFPNSDVGEDEFQFLNTNINMSEDVYNIYNRCKNISLDFNNDTEYKINNWEDKIDPDLNFYNEIDLDCNYVTDSQFNVQIKNNVDFSIIHFNARSLKANFENVKTYLNSLSKEFHIIAISESWFDENINELDYKLDRYNMVFTSRSDKRGGGVVLYVRQDLNFVKKNDFCSSISNVLESVTLEIVLENDKNVIISCIYRTPGTDVDTFTDYIERLLKSIKNGKSIYLCGDINIDLLRYNNHQVTKEFIDLLFSYGLYPIISKPTRVTSLTATVIDNIFTNNVFNICTCSILCNDISDHLLIYCTAKQKGVCEKQNHRFSYTRVYNEKNVSNFKEALENNNWDRVYASDDVDEIFDCFINDFTKLHEVYFPVKRVRVDKKSIEKPWMTKSLVNACRKKNNLYKIFLKNRCVKTETRYKRYKNKLTTILRFCEKQYCTQVLDKYRDNVRQTWKVLNDVIKKKSNASNIPNEFISDEKIVKGRKEIANGFNDFFVNIGPNLAGNIKEHNDIDVTNYMSESNNNTMFLSPVDENEVTNIVRNCKNKTSEDSNSITMKLLKEVFCCIVKPYTHICNLSFKTGTFPNRMKLAKVIPLFKSGNKNSFNNYRPVSLLSQFSKILEKLFDVRLQSFIDKYDLLSNCQYGFRPNCSTSLALMELVEEISSSLDNKKVTIGVFIDLKRAFDTIDHSLLLKKLEHYGIRGLANNWLYSYLKNRKQFVQVDEHRSTMLEILCGVPQGSVLGPKLFILYINDICNVSNLLKFILFADDTNIFRSGSDLNVLCREISKELDKLNVWFNVNKLSLNVAKTNYMVFGKDRNQDSILTIQGNVIEKVHKTKFLGVITDDKLQWSEQICYVKSKLVKCISVMYKAKSVFNSEALLMLYNTLLQPYLNYCAEVWANTYKSRLKNIVVIQKRAIRLICNVCSRTHTSDLFKKLNILKFTDLVEYKCGIIMFNAYSGKLPRNLQNMFNVVSQASSYGTRQRNKFSRKFCRTNIKAHCITSVEVKVWNNLPVSITELNLLYIFKKAYKKYIISNY